MACAGVPRETLRIIEANQQSAPVRVIGIAQTLGLRVFQEGMRASISGKLYRDDESDAGWSISVNRTHPKTRQRFTIAHELGHFSLHLDKANGLVEDDTFYRSHLSNRQEAEANRFAADVLMPFSLIDALVQGGLTTAEELAEALEVSLVAMNIRLGNPT